MMSPDNPDWCASDINNNITEETNDFESNLDEDESDEELLCEMYDHCTVTEQSVNDTTSDSDDDNVELSIILGKDKITKWLDKPSNN